MVQKTTTPPLNANTERGKALVKVFATPLLIISQKTFLREYRPRPLLRIYVQHDPVPRHDAFDR